MNFLARTIVICSARLAPRASRARWREEWLAEIEAAAKMPARWRIVLRVFGAPADAFLLRWTLNADLGVRNGWTADCRDAWRSLAKTPLQTATMVGCLAVGGALVVTVAAIFNALTWGDSPGVRDQSRLVRIGVTPLSGRPLYALSGSDYARADWSSIHDTLEGVAARAPLSFKVRLSDALVRIPGSFVTGNYFSVVGTVPAAGRILTPDDDRPSASAVGVISHAMWLRRFGGDFAAIGRLLIIDERPVEIVGVAPAGFADMEAGDLGETAASREKIWMPLSQSSSWRRTQEFSVTVIGRLTPGLSIEEAESRLHGFLPGLTAGSQNAPARLAMRPLRLLPMRGKELLTFFALLLAVPVVVLLIGCANTASLQAARTSWRIHELAVRTSMGATRLRLARLLSIEIFLTAAAAMLVAWALTVAALKYSASVLPFVVSVDWRVLIVAVVLPVFLTLIAGCLPSWRATGFDVLSGLRLGGRTPASGSLRIRRVLVTGQVALSVILVFGAILITRAIATGPLSALQNGGNVVVAALYVTEPPASAGERRTAVATFMREATTMAEPQDIAFTTGGLRMPSAVRIGAPERRLWSEAHIATRSFFDIVKLELRRGRLYEEREPGVMVVNEAFARRFAPSGEVLGMVFDVTSRGLGADPSLPEGTAVSRRVIGVVADGYERFSPGDDPQMPFVYLPLDTRHMSSVGVFMRASDATAVQARLATLAASLHPPAVLRPLGTVQSVMAQPYEGILWLARALSGAGALALVLAAIGLFALIATSVAQRAHEFGVRHALGATGAQIMRLVIRDVSRMVLTGFVLGILLALPIWMLIRNEILRHATLIDVRAILAGFVAFAAVMAAAAYLPARRAALVDPLAALRGD